MSSNVHTGSVSRRVFGRIALSFVVAGTMLSTATQTFAQGKSPKAGAKAPKKFVFRSGVALSGRSKKDPAPYKWFAVDLESRKVVNQASKRWGFLLLPPGKYLVLVRKHYNGNAVPWAIVDVKRGKTHAITVKSGLILSGQENEKAPYKWFAVSAKSKKTVNYASRRWGFLPLTPGKYKIYVQSNYGELPVLVGEVTINRDQVISS